MAEMAHLTSSIRRSRFADDALPIRVRFEPRPPASGRSLTRRPVVACLEASAVFAKPVRFDVRAAHRVDQCCGLPPSCKNVAIFFMSSRVNVLPTRIAESLRWPVCPDSALTAAARGATLMVTTQQAWMAPAILAVADPWDAPRRRGNRRGHASHERKHGVASR